MEKCIPTTETANASIFSKIGFIEKYTEVNETMFSMFRKIWQKTQEMHAWTDLKKLGGIPIKKKKKSAQPVKLDPNELNSF
mgnify:CR=1 FL=1